MRTVAQVADALTAAGVPIERVISEGSTARVVFSPTATREQREAASVILAQFNPNAPDPADVRRTLLTDLSNVPDWTPEQQNRVLRLILHQILGDDRLPG